MKIGIIGSAGRKDDKAYLKPQLWQTMISHATLAIEALNKNNEPIELVSGGAAFADHLAVRLYLNNISSNLTLHFPAAFQNSKFLASSSAFDAGRTANYHHKNFSDLCSLDSLREIQKAIDKGALTTVSNGFKKRNLLVADVDLLLAYTFGTHSQLVKSSHPGYQNHTLAGLKDGGTAHTWDNSHAPIKLHTNLKAWC